MKIASLFAAALILSSCAKEQKTESVPTVILSGTIENRGDLEVLLYDTYNNPITIPIATDGTFKDTISITEPSYYTITAGRQWHTLFLNPEETLDITLDLASQDEIPIFKGTLASENDYLSHKISTNPASDYSTFYAGDETLFLKTIDSLGAAQKKALADSESSEIFKDIEVKSIDFERQDYIKRYPSYHSRYIGDKKYEVSDNLLIAYQDFDYDHEENARLYPVYRKLVITEFQDSYEEIDSTFSDYGKMLSFIGNKKSARLRDELLGFTLFFFSPNSDDVSTTKDQMLSLATAQSVKDKIQTKYEAIKDLTPGNSSPEFNYENYKGGKTALSDLRGKYVYIDVWATWCGPCLAEIPSLKQIEHDFENEEIAFVSISIDEKSDYQKWRDMIESRTLGGIQLMSDQNWKSTFVEEYAIDGIPRFILLDPNGNIISADAKRPSNPELALQLKDLTSESN